MTRNETDEQLDDLTRRLEGSSRFTPEHAPVQGKPRIRKLKETSTSAPQSVLNPSPPGEVAIPLKETPNQAAPVLWSVRHPLAYKVSRLFLPRLPVVVIASWLIYAMLINLWRGEYLFFVRWYRQSWILPRLVHVVSSKETLSEWWSEWGPFTLLVIATGIFVGLVIYFFVWRLFFTDYIRYSEGVETPEGRCYWTEGRGFWFDLWDTLYYRKGAWPKRNDVTLYLNTRRLPPNPAAPSRRMLKVRLELGPAGKLERRGLYQLVGHELPYRRITGIREFSSHSQTYSSDSIRIAEASDTFKTRVKDLVRDTQVLTKANVGVRLEKVKSGTVIIDEELKGMILDERRSQKT